MKATDKILTKKQLKEAKAAIANIKTILASIQFVEQIEDLDDHTDGLAYDAHNKWYEASDAIYSLEDVIKRIENFQKDTFTEFIGKELSVYDSWNGSYRSITIEKAKQETGCVLFTGANSYEIYVDNEFLPSLIKVGEAVRCNEVDHCIVRTTWKLN